MYLERVGSDGVIFYATKLRASFGNDAGVHEREWIIDEYFETYDIRSLTDIGIRIHENAINGELPNIAGQDDWVRHILGYTALKGHDHKRGWVNYHVGRLSDRLAGLEAQYRQVEKAFRQRVHELIVKHSGHIIVNTSGYRLVQLTRRVI